MRRTIDPPAGVPRAALRHLVPVLVLVPLLFGLLLWQVRSLVRASESVEHADRVLAQLHAAEKLVLQLQTGLRGYALTGQRTFLEPYEAARPALAPLLDDLGALSRDDAPQDQELARLRAALTQWLPFSERLIAAKARGEDVAATISQGFGKAHLDAMSGALGRMVQAEERLRAVRSSSARTWARRTSLAAGVAFLSLTLPIALLLRERRRWESSLALSESRFRALSDQVTEYAIFLLDPDGHIASWGAGAERLYGYGAQEVLDKPFTVLFPPEGLRRDAPASELAHAHETGQHQSTEWRLRKDGSRFWADVVTTRLVDRDGHLFGYAKVTRDLTERMKAEQALRESEERFRMALDEAPIGMALVALDGHFLRVNHALCNIVGYTPEELTRRTFQAITHPEDVDADVGLAQRLGRGELERLQVDKRYLHRSGGVVDVRLTVSAVRDRTGAPLYFISMMEDVTEQKRAEAALRASEAKFSRLVSIAADAIISLDEQQHIVIFNRGAEAIFGWKAEEVLGKPLDLLLPERFRPAHHHQVESFAAEPATSRQMGGRRNLYGLRKSGEEFPAEAAISKLRAEHGWFFTVVLRDVTEHRRAETEQRLRLQVQGALSSSLDYHASLQRTLRLLTQELADCCCVDLVVGERMVRHVELARQGPEARALAEVLEHLDLDRTLPYPVSETFATGRPVLLERVTREQLDGVVQSEAHRRALEALAPTSLLALPLLARGRTMGVLALVRSGPRPAFEERDLRLAQDLASRMAVAMENAQLFDAAQQAITARDDVLGIVAHDLRNPLNNIVMQAQQLQRPGDADERAAQAAAKIHQSAMRMNRIIQDLLDVARTESGRLSVERTRLAAGEVVAAALEDQQPLARQESLQLRADVAPDLPDVWADRDRLLQVLENLIGNAVKFTGAGGTVTVGAAPREGEVLFWVTDTGPGISAEDAPHLFDRFWQAGRKDRRGAGLGLSIVKGIIEAHGGRIWVESTPGRGARFLYTLPAFASHAQHADATGAP